jgi:hypothetical protein
VIEVGTRALVAVASLPGVRSVTYAQANPGMEGELEALTIAGQRIASASGTGLGLSRGRDYASWLDAVELSGEGVTLALCDTGVDQNDALNRRGF